MIEIRGVTKTFGSNRVLDDVSFVAANGTVTGFLGSNGTGKSTTMRVLLGLITPNRGTALIDGVPYTRQASPMSQMRAVQPFRLFVPALARLHEQHRARPCRRSHGPDRTRQCAEDQGGQILARHGPAPRDRRGAVGESEEPRARRAGERPRRRRCEVGARPVPQLRGGWARGAAQLALDERSGAHRRQSGDHRRRPDPTHRYRGRFRKGTFTPTAVGRHAGRGEDACDVRRIATYQFVRQQVSLEQAYMERTHGHARYVAAQPQNGGVR